jgi:hypothetical protein
VILFTYISLAPVPLHCISAAERLAGLRVLADFPWYHHLFTLSGVQGADKRGSGRGKGKSGRRCRPGAVIRLLLKCRRVLPDVTAVACSNVGIINHPHFCRPGTLTDSFKFVHVKTHENNREWPRNKATRSLERSMYCTTDGCGFAPIWRTSHGPTYAQ